MMKPIVIGIAGGSGSGKSTFAQALAKELTSQKAVIIATDHYYYPEDQLPMVTASNGKQYRDYNCPEAVDWKTLKKDIYHVLQQATADVLIVEGLFVLWNEDIRLLCDVRVFIDCPADVRVVRRIRRNLAWGLSFDEIADVYLDLVRFRHETYVAPTAVYADVTLDSSEDDCAWIDAIKDNIKDKLNQKRC